MWLLKQRIQTHWNLVERIWLPFTLRSWAAVAQLVLVLVFPESTIKLRFLSLNFHFLKCPCKFRSRPKMIWIKFQEFSVRLILFHLFIAFLEFVTQVGLPIEKKGTLKSDFLNALESYKFFPLRSLYPWYRVFPSRISIASFLEHQCQSSFF